jgi:hypothetical protein
VRLGHLGQTLAGVALTILCLGKPGGDLLPLARGVVAGPLQLGPGGGLALLGPGGLGWP